jgi:F-type H+-transporting ATPase subunit epsilon
MTFRVTILTPEDRVYDDEADALVVPGSRGTFGILAHHAPLVGAVAPGILSVRREAQTVSFAIGEGVIEVGENRATILVDTARRAANPADAEIKLEEYLKDLALPALVTPDSMERRD